MFFQFILIIENNESTKAIMNILDLRLIIVTFDTDNFQLKSMEFTFESLSYFLSSVFLAHVILY